jgi:hypothetical protein
VYVNYVYAQRDYVITNSGDTLRCVVNGPSIFGIYKYSFNNNTVKITLRNTKEFFIANKDLTMAAVFIDNYSTPMFMKVIEKGQIRLFEIIMNNGYSAGNTPIANSSMEWFVSKGSDTVSLLKYNGTASLMGFRGTKRRQNDFIEMIKDNKNVYDKYVAEDKFSFKQIRNLVHLYNTGQQLSD